MLTSHMFQCTLYWIFNLTILTSSLFSNVLHIVHIAWKSLKMLHLNFAFLAFSTIFCPSKKLTCLLTLFDRNVKWDFFCDFQTLWWGIKTSVLFIHVIQSLLSMLTSETKKGRILITVFCILSLISATIVMVLYHTYLRFDDSNEASEITHSATTVSLNNKEGNFIYLEYI